MTFADYVTRHPGATWKEYLDMALAIPKRPRPECHVCRDGSSGLDLEAQTEHISSCPGCSRCEDCYWTGFGNVVETYPPGHRGARG